MARHNPYPACDAKPLENLILQHGKSCWMMFCAKADADNRRFTASENPGVRRLDCCLLFENFKPFGRVDLVCWDL